MASHVESDSARRDVRTFILEGTSKVASTTFDTRASPQKIDVDEQSLYTSAWTRTLSVEPSSVPMLALPSVSSSTTSSLPLSTRACKTQMDQAQKQHTDLIDSNKVIIGSVTAAVIIAMLASVAYWLHRRETLRGRPRASSLMSPFSPPLLQEDGKPQEVMLQEELGWLAVNYHAKTDSRHDSFDEGLGSIRGKAEQKTPTPAKRNHKSLQIDTQSSTADFRKAGGPLNSNPIAEDDFGYPLERSPDPLGLEYATDEDFGKKEPLPTMGDGALTAKASRESIVIIETMQPASPKHRQLTPTKSILKKENTSPATVEKSGFEAAMITPPALSKLSKRSALKQKVGGILKHKKDEKSGPAEEALESSPPTSPTSASKRKGVSFGEDVVRRISYSPETDEGDWQTIDSETKEGGKKEKTPSQS